MATAALTGSPTSFVTGLGRSTQPVIGDTMRPATLPTTILSVVPTSPSAAVDTEASPQGGTATDMLWLVIVLPLCLAGLLVGLVGLLWHRHRHSKGPRDRDVLGGMAAPGMAAHAAGSVQVVNNGAYKPESATPGCTESTEPDSLVNMANLIKDTLGLHKSVVTVADICAAASSSLGLAAADIRALPLQQQVEQCYGALFLVTEKAPALQADDGNLHVSSAVDRSGWGEVQMHAGDQALRHDTVFARPTGEATAAHTYTAISVTADMGPEIENEVINLAAPAIPVRTTAEQPGNYALLAARPGAPAATGDHDNYAHPYCHLKVTTRTGTGPGSSEPLPTSLGSASANYAAGADSPTHPPTGRLGITVRGGYDIMVDAHIERPLLKPAHVYFEYKPPTAGEDFDYIQSVVSVKAKVLERMRIDAGRVTVGKVLGSGQFGQVFAGVLAGMLAGSTKVAVKTCKPVAEIADANDDLATEAVLTGSFSHDNVVGAFGVYEADAMWHLVLELCEKGPLHSLLATAREAGQDATAFGIPQLVVYAGGAAAGMVYMAGLGFVHRDLACRNVLVDGNDTAKIADFGLSREQTYGTYTAVTNRPLPLKWMSPEAIEYVRFTTASDVWSFAVLVWEVLSMAATPYPTIGNSGLCHALQIDGYRLPAPKGCPAEIYELLLECWNLEASSRPSFAQIEERLHAIDFKSTVPYKPVAPWRIPSSTMMKSPTSNGGTKRGASGDAADAVAARARAATKPVGVSSNDDKPLAGDNMYALLGDPVPGNTTAGAATGGGDEASNEQDMYYRDNTRNIDDIGLYSDSRYAGLPDMMVAIKMASNENEIQEVQIEQATPVRAPSPGARKVCFL